uniref:Uncharacterized protein n=2 Tax=Guillardia theta TaxID=55529 RepID=A0A6U6BYB6_GUITH|mmetsp:Transcript_41153/g.129265  ORF Transcript_41153/g.129265 Transcript_41153/m.129265 type:complete len:188 (+) Transcript_41153:147-710(+)
MPLRARMILSEMRMPNKSILSSWIKRGNPQDPEDQKQSIQLDQSEAKSKAFGGLAPTTMVRTRRAAMEAMRRRSAEKSWEEAEEKVKRQLQAMERARELEFEKLKERLQKEKQGGDDGAISDEQKKSGITEAYEAASEHIREESANVSRDNSAILWRHTISGRPTNFGGNHESSLKSIQDSSGKVSN